MPRIAYIDDEPFIRGMAREVLEDSGYAVEDFAEPAEFLSSDCRGFDAIFSDYNMPGMNGNEMIKELRSRGINTPACIVTGQNDGSVYRKIRSECINEEIFIIRKPFEISELLDAASLMVGYSSGDTA